jgi:hypothetical protein
MENRKFVKFVIVPEEPAAEEVEAVDEVAIEEIPVEEAAIDWGIAVEEAAIEEIAVENELPGIDEIPASDEREGGGHEGDPRE